MNELFSCEGAETASRREEEGRANPPGSQTVMSQFLANTARCAHPGFLIGGNNA